MRAATADGHLWLEEGRASREAREVEGRVEIATRRRRVVQVIEAVLDLQAVVIDAPLSFGRLDLGDGERARRLA